jgi:hypothetical protein
MEYQLKAKLYAAARKDAWERGCTCGSQIRIALLTEGPPRPKVAVEHLVGCPLWTDRDLASLPPDVEPDPLIEVERP